MLDLILIFFLIALNGLFAMSEVAIISLKKARLQHLVDKGSRGAMMALKLQEDPSRFLSSIQIGITSIGILSGIVGEKSLGGPFSEFLMSLGLTQALTQPVSSVSIIVFLTYMSVVFGELVPKTIGLVLSEKIACVVSIPLNVLANIFFPLVWLFSKTGKMCLKVLGLGNIEQEPVSNEEIKQLMSEGENAGVFHKEEGKMVANVLHMDEKSATSVMTHRSEWDVINIRLPFEEVKAQIIASEHSKLLIVDGTLDNLLGFISIKNILSKLCNSANFDVTEFIEQPLYLPITVTASQVLEELKRNRRDISIVINEYGENVGLITMSDIMSAIVGDIEPEDEPGEEDIVDRKDGSFLIDGLIALDKLKSEFDLGDEFDRFAGISNLNGFMMGSFGKIPSVGAILNLESNGKRVSLEVVDMDKNCIDKVMARFDAIQPNQVETQVAETE